MTATFIRQSIEKRNFIEVTDVSDVNHLNGLVCAWASKCVYYHTVYMSGEHVSWTFDHINDSRTKMINEQEILTEEKSSIIIARYPFPAFGMCLSFLKFLDKVKPH